MTRKYCLVTPCRNEEEYARNTLESVVNQSVQPTLWVIVDDGSTDSTPNILKEYAAKYSYIRIVRRVDRGVRSVGPGVIEAFYEGYSTINPDDFDFICKLDLDLDLPLRYYEILMERMEQNHLIGTCSGKAYFIDPKSGKTISEKCGDEASVGMTKFYRVSCFKEIGGFVREVMWDGIDGHTCRMKGWIACSWDDQELRFIHLRPMGSSHQGILTGRQRHGFGQYFMGTSFVYMLASALFRMTRPPLFLGGAAMLCGYINSWVRCLPRYDAPGFRPFLRRYQMKCLLIGKQRAVAQLNKEIALQRRASVELN